MATVFTDGQSQRFGAQTNKKCYLELDGRGSRIGILADLELSDPNAGLQPVLFFFSKNSRFLVLEGVSRTSAWP